MKPFTSDKNLHLFLLLSLSGIFIWSFINPHDLFTWFLEVLPVIIGITILFCTYNQFQFTSLAYVLIWFHAIILLVGGHYTYEKMPLFNWVGDVFGFSRNHYDRLGHFAQGFVPAIIAREILLRKSPLKPGRWLFFLLTASCLAISAAYELFEWVMAEATGTAANAFLGTQGDVWDTQWDMAFALCGAIVSQLFLGKLHDESLKRLLVDKKEA